MLNYTKSKTNLILLSIMVLVYIFFVVVASWWSSISNNLILEEISISNTKFIEKSEFYELASGILSESH